MLANCLARGASTSIYAGEAGMPAAVKAGGAACS